jgi:hypothetical protein
MQVRSYVHYIARKVTYITYRVYFLFVIISISYYPPDNRSYRNLLSTLLTKSRKTEISASYNAVYGR